MPTLGLLNQYSNNADSEETYQFIQEKLNQCLQSHVNCPKARETTLSKQILKIDTNCTDTIKLLEPENLHGEYATLSYCWGKDQLLKTTISSLGEMFCSISIGTLPPVFQDAIQVTRKLQIEYIWIDFLYIIQDSQED